MNFTVAFTVSGLRQKYLRQALDSWAQVDGVQDAVLMFFLEPMPARMRFPVAEFREFLARSFKRAWVVEHEERLGCLKNTRHAMDVALAGSGDFAILAEEDLVVSRDVLDYFSWAQRWRDDSQTVAVCGHSFHTTGASWQAVRTSWFSPILWGTWTDRWLDYIRPGWTGVAGNTEAWDANLRDRICSDHKVCIFPAWSRSQHIGRQSTLTPGQLADYFYKQSISKSFAPNYGTPINYEEVDRSLIELTV